MPVVFRESGLRYYFFSNEGTPREHLHIHVKGRGCDAKIWLEPELLIADNYGFNAMELSDILRIVAKRRDQISRAWHDHFGDSSPL